jgi:hypothetical protein
MPNYVSEGGVWSPANEKVPLIDHEGKDGRQPGDPYIYEGPDRAALYELWLAGEKTFGSDFRHDPEFLLRIKNLGYQGIDDYLTQIGYDPIKEEKKNKEKKEVVLRHEPLKKGKAVKELGGGRDFSGMGGDKLGDFGLPKELG